MKKLVLCVDRDDDMGVKAHIISPIIGRQENLNAAVALALADPEDSDVNTTLGGIKIYDDLIKNGEEAEIVTLCGDIKLGKRSDEVIATQFDIVIREIEPDRVVLVSDGAEDEYIVPLITSRVPVDSIRRIVVKQRKSIEDTYYLIVRLMGDDKIQRRFLLPIAILLLFWGLTSILAASLNFPNIGMATILLIVGAYLLIRIFDLEESFMRLGRNMKSGIEKGYISTFTGLISLLFIIFVLLDGAVEMKMNPQHSFYEGLLIMMQSSLWFLIGGGALYTLGRLMDTYIRKGYWVSSIMMSFFTLISLGLWAHAILKISNYFIGLGPQPDFTNIFLVTISGLMVFFLGRNWSTYIRKSNKYRINNR